MIKIKKVKRQKKINPVGQEIEEKKKIHLKNIKKDTEEKERK